MKMAKASEADLSMALKVTGWLESIERGYMPDDLVEDDERGERIDFIETEQYERLIDGLRTLLRQGSICRVVWGMATICDPRNKIINPNADTLEVHPDLANAAEQRDALKREVDRLGRRLAKIKYANRCIGTRLLKGRSLRDVPVKRFVKGGAA